MDGNVIPFPVRHDVGTDDLVEDDPLDGFTLTVEDMACPDCGTLTDDHDGCDGPVTDPDEIVEADGRWVWEPVEGAPEHEPPVGMVAHRVSTMCKWTYRHLMEEQPIPQPCCYSVLITTKRLPGPVRSERSWLAPEEGDAPSD